MFEEKDFPAFENAWEAFVSSDIAKLEELSKQSDFPHGIDPWSENYWLTHAIRSCSIETVEWVLRKHVDVHYNDAGFTALKCALQVEIDCQLDQRYTDAEAAKLTIELIDLLVDSGADINQRLNLNYTAMHAAAAWSSVEVVRHLLALGGNPALLADDYDTPRPVDDAKDLKRWEVHALMCEAMGLAPSGRPLDT